MRWERLFEELDARFDAEATLERDAEIADRTRRERAQIALYSRLLANVGRGPISLRLPGTPVHGSSSALQPTWVLTGCCSSTLPTSRPWYRWRR